MRLGLRRRVGKTERGIGLFEGGKEVVIDPTDNSRSVDNILPNAEDMGVAGIGATGHDAVSDISEAYETGVTTDPIDPTQMKEGEDSKRFIDGNVKERKGGREVVNEPDRGVKGGILGRRSRKTEDVDKFSESPFSGEIKGPEDQVIENEEIGVQATGELDEREDDFYYGKGNEVEGVSEFDEVSGEDEENVQYDLSLEPHTSDDVMEAGESDDKEHEAKLLNFMREQEDVGDELTPTGKVGMRKRDSVLSNVVPKRHKKEMDFKSEQKSDKMINAMRGSKSPKTGQADGKDPRYKNKGRETINPNKTA